ncbi:autotransporter, partial [Salmonella enterica subsp. enterica serovar Newport str. SHSN005]
MLTLAHSAPAVAEAPGKITNLAAGTLAADSTDAVNGSQLFA